MDINKKEKIKKFVSDKLMNEAVKEVLKENFLKPRGNRDVHQLAAERIAVELLIQGFQEINRIAETENKIDRNNNQVAL
ncbi:hypothetical protein COV16_04890 [Candidatus Woesearchaeota archaeon CG10_big_fil_rev_8_21_14_0_10_34_8]|nr:MAG: hypothetical protein COV16_04890 [Candidatus Woesearchaeota archaeon CG10_big_fil_rev_8_21_14_0_10_34_8]